MVFGHLGTRVDIRKVIKRFSHRSIPLYIIFCVMYKINLFFIRTHCIYFIYLCRNTRRRTPAQCVSSQQYRLTIFYYYNQWFTLSSDHDLSMDKQDKIICHLKWFPDDWYRHRAPQKNNSVNYVAIIDFYLFRFFDFYNKNGFITFMYLHTKFLVMI